MTLAEMQKELTERMIPFEPDSSPETLLELLNSAPTEDDEEENLGQEKYPDPDWQPEPASDEGVAEQPPAEPVPPQPSTPQYSEEEIKRIEKSLEPTTVTVEDRFKDFARTPDGLVHEKTGILIPQQALIEMQKTPWVFEAREASDRVTVVRRFGTKSEIVRTYERGLHGPSYKDLAAQFIRKKNRRMLLA